MPGERKPHPRQANFLGRLRARFRRARAEGTGGRMFTARHSPNEGTRVPDPPVPGPVLPTSAPGVRVHASRLDRPAPRVRLTPSQALELAREGPGALRRPRPRAD